MSDRELLLERLERLAIVFDELMPQCAELVRDAIALLKEQEDLGTELTNAVELIHKKNEQIKKLLKDQEAKQIVGIADSIEGIEVGYCPSCGRSIVNKKIDETKFCKFCGQAVKWG